MIGQALLKGAPLDRDFDDRAHARVALFASIVAGVIAAIGFACRLGFADNSPVRWAEALGLAWFLIHLSSIVRHVLRAGWPAAATAWWVGHAPLTLLGLALLAVCGCDALAMGGIAFVRVARGIFALLGALGVVLSAIASASGRLRDTAALVAFAGLFGVWGAGASWGSGCQHPLYVEGIVFGRAPVDTLFHASFANMLRTYGVSTTGLDGLPPMPYHFGTHWLFGRLCNLLDWPIIDFYNRGYPVLFVPFGVFAIGAFAIGIAANGGRLAGLFAPTTADGAPDPNATRLAPVRRDSDDATAALERPPGAPRGGLGLLFWFVLTAGFIGVFPYSTVTIIISESYAVAVAVSLLGLTVLVAFLVEALSGRTRAASRLAGIVLLAALFAVVGLLKISIMLVLAAAGLYLFVRLRMYRRSVACWLWAAIALSGGYAYWLTTNPAYGEVSGFVPFGFLRMNVDPLRWCYFWLVFYFWVWIVVAVRLWEERARTLSELARAVKARRLLDVEFLLAAAAAGAAPGLLLTGYSSTHYFSEYQQWLAVGLLLSIVIRGTYRQSSFSRTLGASDRDSVATAGGRPAEPATRPAAREMTVGGIFVAAVALSAAGTMVANTGLLVSLMVQADLASRGHPKGDTGLGRALAHGRFAEAGRILSLTAGEVESRLRGDKSAVALLQSLDRMPRSEKRASLLFIPKSNRDFWDLLGPPNAPTSGPLVATALSGVAMIDGLPSVKPEERWLEYGYFHYPRPDPGSHQPALAEYLPVLRRRTADLGFSQLIVIAGEGRGSIAIQKYDCP